MAKIAEEIVVIKLSKLVKDSEVDGVQLVDAETLANLEVVAQELVGDSVVVEIEKA
jgi:hypothetical protein